MAAGAIGSVSQQIDVILYSFGVISSDGWTESEMGGFASYNHEGDFRPLDSTCFTVQRAMLSCRRLPLATRTSEGSPIWGDV